MPDNPGAWLTTTARNRAINRIHRDRTLLQKTRLLDVPQTVEDTVDETTFPDERLELIFTCCHPALATEAQVALTLRTLGRPHDDRDRARLPGARGDDGAAPGARQEQDPHGRHPVPRAAAAPPARPAGRGAGGRLPDLQRGVRGPQRPVRRGAAPRALAGRADARRARGAGPGGADAAARLAPRRAVRRRRARAAGRPGPCAVGRGPDRRWPRRARPRPRAARPRPVRACRPRSPRCTPTTRTTGARSRSSTPSSGGSPARPWSS